MIRLELTVKDRYGYASSSDLERYVKRALLSAITDALEEKLAEPVRIQFLAPPATKKKRKAS